MNGLDWPALLRLGVQQASLKPVDFWDLTPFELMLFLGLDGSEKPLNRARLAELEQEFSQTHGGKDGCI